MTRRSIADRPDRSTMENPMQPSFPLNILKFQCVVADAITIITWAQNEMAARKIVADFEGVPVAWVRAQAVEA